jgi:hypothetical protein
MSFKVCVNDEIHKLHKLPATLSEFNTQVQYLFGTTIPKFFILHYFDEKGNNTPVRTEYDLQTILNKIKANKSVKVYITEKFNLSNIPLTSSVELDMSDFILKPEIPKRLDE